MHRRGGLAGQMNEQAAVLLEQRAILTRAALYRTYCLPAMREWDDEGRDAGSPTSMPAEPTI